MAKLSAVYHQSSFGGGEWSNMAQGRSDLNAYKTAMNVCLNGLPVEQGSWVRRSGTQYIGPTVERRYSKLLSFETNGSYSMVIVLSEDITRFIVDTDWLTTNDDRVITASSSSSGVVSVDLDDDHDWEVGETVQLILEADTDSDAGLYVNRLLQIGAVGVDTLALGDDQGNAFDFDSTTDALVGCTVKRLKELGPIYDLSALPSVRIVQTRDAAVLLCKFVHPKTIGVTSEDNVLVFDGDPSDAPILDGPYLDSQKATDGTNEGGSASAYTGTITFTPDSSTFTDDDIGRMIRLFHEPLQWNDATTYSYGDTVTYEDQWWISIASGTYASDNVGVVPGTLATISGASVVLWASTPEAGRWAWGNISAHASSSCTVVLVSDLNSANGLEITEWRLGVWYSDHFPTCGVFHDGRLILAGAVANRLDVSKSNDKWMFSPSDEFGNVTDDSGMSMELNFSGQQKISWVKSDPKGLIVGTEAGEVLISSTGGITPYDREATQMTSYMCADIEACRAGSSIIFAQYYRREVMEYTPNAFGTRFLGTSINLMSRHLTASLMMDIAYQTEPTPIVWIRGFNGDLSGITYHRAGEEVTFGPHRHQIADNGRYVASMCVASSTSWRGDLLYLCTYAPNEGYNLGSDYNNGTDFAIEVMRPLLLEY